jgi:hypothetical protein
LFFFLIFGDLAFVAFDVLAFVALAVFDPGGDSGSAFNRATASEPPNISHSWKLVSTFGT